MSWRPEYDGETHINVYSKGKTRLGRLLTNFARTPVEVPGDGPFESLEGYWYWLLSERSDRRSELRYLSGFRAKHLGRQISSSGRPHPDQMEWFKERFRQSMLAKTAQRQDVRELLGASSLPLVHYYVYGTSCRYVRRGRWVIDYWEEIRRRLQEGQTLRALTPK